MDEDEKIRQAFFMQTGVVQLRQNRTRIETAMVPLMQAVVLVRARWHERCAAEADARPANKGVAVAAAQVQYHTAAAKALRNLIREMHFAFSGNDWAEAFESITERNLITDAHVESAMAMLANPEPSPS